MFYVHNLQIFENLTNFHNTCWEIRGNKGYSIAILHIFLQLLMTRWRTRAIFMWDLHSSAQFTAKNCYTVRGRQKYAVSLRKILLSEKKVTIRKKCELLRLWLGGSK